MLLTWLGVLLGLQLASREITAQEDDCAGFICGHLAACAKNTGGFDVGCNCNFSSPEVPWEISQLGNMTYCRKVCNNSESDNCPENTTCSQTGLTEYCTCMDGFGLSSTGQCLEITGDDETTRSSGTVRSTTKGSPITSSVPAPYSMERRGDQQELDLNSQRPPVSTSTPITSTPEPTTETTASSLETSPSSSATVRTTATPPTATQSEVTSTMATTTTQVTTTASTTPTSNSSQVTTSTESTTHATDTTTTITTYHQTTTTSSVTTTSRKESSPSSPTTSPPMTGITIKAITTVPVTIPNTTLSAKITTALGNQAVIVGLAVGFGAALLVIIILVVAIVFLRRRRSKGAGNGESGEEDEMSLSQTPSTELDSSYENALFVAQNRRRNRASPAVEPALEVSASHPPSGSSDAVYENDGYRVDSSTGNIYLTLT